MNDVTTVSNFATGIKYFRHVSVCAPFDMS